VQLQEVKDCPISGSPAPVRYARVRDAFFGTPGQWTYRQNSRTGHLWLDPRPADACVAELYAEYYTHPTAAPDSGKSLWDEAVELARSSGLGYPAPGKPRTVARLLARLPTVADAAELDVMRIPAAQTGSLLDVGCGSGEYLRRMRKAGWRVTGTEPDAKAAARLVAQESFEVYGSLEELMQAHGRRFDVIVLSHVIEHLADPMRTLTQLNSLLAQGGRLLITTPNARSLGLRIFGASWRGLEPPRHFNVFTPESLNEALMSAGFRVERMRTEVRLARGIWFQSYLARAGGSKLEIARDSSRLALKLAGYAFQLFEAAALKLRPSLGEEIFCAAAVASDDVKVAQ
jgi:SAM-dependent methyltransferase